MYSVKQTMIQAVPWHEGQIEVGAGSYVAKGLIHCEADAALTLDFPGGSKSVTMTKGLDRSYIGPFTVVSGLVTYG